MGVGRRISGLRRKQGPCGQIGYDKTGDLKWESEKSNPDLEYIISMGKMFDVSMDYLLLGMNDSSVKQAPSKTDQSEKRMVKFTFTKAAFAILLAFGIFTLLMTPLIATVYRNYISQYAPAYTDAYLYLQEWPLRGVVIAGILAALAGTAGIVWVIIKKRIRN